MTQYPIPNTPHRTPSLRSLLSFGLVCLLCIVAVAPLLRSDSPCTHDGAFHYYRVAAMRHALDDGILFTRYLPDLAFGYGYPFFNYRAALSYYLALAFHLTGLTLPFALNLVYVLSILGSALSAYLLARDLFGPSAGVIAAVAYAYAPYQFLDALLRANAPESVALPLMPLILWAFRRLALTGRRRWFLVSIASLVGLLLAHNISSLLFIPFLLAYMIVLWLVYRQQGHWVAAGSAFGLALGLAAFFLGPALLEQEYVQLHMSRVTRNNDFHYNFLPLAEMLAPPTPIDTSLMNPPMRVHLGLPQAILGGIGFVVGLARWWNGKNNTDKERRTTLVLFAIAAAVMLWMSTRSSLWVWENVPLVPFIQFPWRLVGRAILPLSLLAAALPPALLSPTNPGSPTPHHASRITSYVLRFTHHASRIPYSIFRIAYYVTIALLILSAFPYTYPPHGYCANAPYPTIDDVFAYERRTKRVGVDPEGSYFPAWVEQRPEDGSPLEEQYATGSPIRRFDENALPPGASVIEADYSPNRARIAIETPTPFRARYLAFYFPGWQVQIDGEPVALTPTDPEGLISFDVPAGRHTIAVRFGSTPTRTAFTTVSLLALAILLALTIRYPQIHEPANPRIYESTNPQTPESSNRRPSFIIHCSLAIVLLIFKLAVVDRTDTLFRHPTLQLDGTLPGVAHALDQPYADGLTLIGYDQAQTSIPADGTLGLCLYWTAYARPGARYQTVVHLVGPRGKRWSEPDSFRPRGYAKYPHTNTWSPGRYALDSHEVEPLSGTPPGTYDVVLTIFDRDTLAPLSLLNTQGQPAAPKLTLGQVTLTRPRRPTTPPTGDRLDLQQVGDFTLVTAVFDRQQAAPGDTVVLTLMWQAEAKGDEASSSSRAELALQTPNGTDAAVYTLSYPLSAWNAGEVWRSQHDLTLPATLDTDRFTWTVRVKVMGREETIGPVGQISVVAPPHTFTAPPVGIERDAPLGDVATLVGANLEPETWNLEPIPPGSSLTATLVWRAEKTSTTSYHVFFHLLDPEGRLMAQSDAIPANWSRPTTGWLPGEIITDAHTLTIPPDALAGDYTLSTGLYVPNGERVAAPDGSDTIQLATVTVQSQ
jgi:hypothetical protein